MYCVVKYYIVEPNLEKLFCLRNLHDHIVCVWKNMFHIGSIEVLHYHFTNDFATHFFLLNWKSIVLYGSTSIIAREVFFLCSERIWNMLQQHMI